MQNTHLGPVFFKAKNVSVFLGKAVFYTDNAYNTEAFTRNLALL